MLADIASGNADAADVFFLIGVILAVVAAIISYPPPGTNSRFAAVLGWLAVGCVAFGLMML